MSQLKQLKERALQKPEVRREYEALEEEFKIIGMQLKSPTPTSPPTPASLRVLR